MTAQDIVRQEELEQRSLHAELLAALPAEVLTAACLSRDQLPMVVHPGHLMVARGGYFGCLACGHTVGFHTTSALSSPCRRVKTSGSAGAIRRLLAGQLPHAHHSRPGVVDEWPSGELNPRLCLVSRVGVRECTMVALL